MKTLPLIFSLVSILSLTGCDQDKQPRSRSENTQTTAQSVSSEPILYSSFKAFQEGDKQSAIKHFINADWTGSPLFEKESPLNLSESQFSQLTDSDRESKVKDITAQLDSLKKLAVAVMQSGKEALAKGDKEEARKHFVSLQQCATAMEKEESLQLVKLTGQALKKMANKELATIAP